MTKSTSDCTENFFNIFFKIVSLCKCKFNWWWTTIIIRYSRNIATLQMILMLNDLRNFKKVICRNLKIVQIATNESY